MDKCIGDMKLQKAAGVDGIETEHLRYAHPRICVIVALLFNAMLIHGVVPSMFGMGIIVPLIKCHNMNSSSSDNYRGITLSVPYPKSSKCVFWILWQLFHYFRFAVRFQKACWL